MHPQLSLQNDPELLKFLKASTVAYANAKSKEFIFSYVLFFLSVAYPISYIFIKNEDLKYILFIISFLVTISSWIFADYFKGNTTKGAVYKEKFDVMLFELPWKFMLPQPETLETNKLSRAYKGVEIIDWYPTEISSNIPKYTAIAICQRVSSGWDIELRTQYKNILLTILTVYTIAIFLLWTSTSQDGRVVFSLYFSTLSYYTHLISLIKGNKNSINKRQKIVSKLDSYINKKKEFTLDNLRDIQDEIYNTRQEPSKVPNIFFRMYNNKIKTELEDYIAITNAIYDSANQPN
jgi:hypothetical protein